MSVYDKTRILNEANSINAILGSLRKMPEFRNDDVAVQLGRCIMCLENQIISICDYIREMEKGNELRLII